MYSTANIATTQAARIAKRLMKHWQHKFEVESNEVVIVIHMPNARVELKPTDTYLDVRITATAPSTDLVRLQGVVLDHLERMGQEPLSAEWQSYDA